MLIYYYLIPFPKYFEKKSEKNDREPIPYSSFIQPMK